MSGGALGSMSDSLYGRHPKTGTWWVDFGGTFGWGGDLGGGLGGGFWWVYGVWVF